MLQSTMYELSAPITSQTNLNYNSPFLVQKYTAAISEHKFNKVQPNHYQTLNAILGMSTARTIQKWFRQNEMW